MPFYHRLGEIPKKRHTQFKKPNGKLYREEVMGTRGFSGIQSILYHTYQPTSITKTEIVRNEFIDLVDNATLEPRHVKTTGFQSHGDPITSRIWLMLNNQVKIGLATPDSEMKYFYRNGSCDELLFIHAGSGKLLTQFGDLEFGPGDYIVIPVGTTYQIEHHHDLRCLCIESGSQIQFPRRYMNEYGQLLEHAPFCERDIRVPKSLNTKDERGEFEIHVRMGNQINRHVLDHHPFDVVGWDGYLYPWIFNISDFEPITGRIHMPPPIHQTFWAEGFVICSFVPRMYDYHPLAIPVPYNHSNVNSDEVLYYVEGNFMSRKGIDVGSFTHHPAGLPHGPHPGTVEASLGQKETKELAVMVDTFAPLQFTAVGAGLCDPGYARSWVGGD